MKVEKINYDKTYCVKIVTRYGTLTIEDIGADNEVHAAEIAELLLVEAVETSKVSEIYEC